MPRTKDPNAPTVVKACTSLDDLTLTLLEKIRHKNQLTKTNAFYQNVWTNLVFEGGQRFSQLRLDWTPEENALLLIYAKHLFSSSNRSEAVRVLLNYYAVQNKFASVGQVKKAVISPN
jgi:hypothetical protein